MGKVKQAQLHLAEAGLTDREIALALCVVSGMLDLLTPAPAKVQPSDILGVLLDAAFRVTRPPVEMDV